MRDLHPVPVVSREISHRTRALPRFCCLLLMWALMLRPASAHWADMSVARVITPAGEVVLTVTLPTCLLAPEGEPTAQAVARRQSELCARAGALCKVGDVNGEAFRLRAVRLAEHPLVADGQVAPPPTHSTWMLTFERPAEAVGLSFDYQLFVPEVPTATCLITIDWQGTVLNHVFTPTDTTLYVGAPAMLPQALHFIRLGAEHILTGYDHGLFLICLLMLGGSLLDLVKIITAFTVAHSITLTLAVMGWVNVPGRAVESLIALSIGWMAFENLRGRVPPPLERWGLTFVFGLVHGLGFATCLSAADIPRASRALCIGSFNVGVEIGQVFIVLSAWTLLHLIRNASWQPRFRYAVSAAVLGISLVWFVQRAFC